MVKPIVRAASPLCGLLLLFSTPLARALDGEALCDRGDCPADAGDDAFAAIQLRAGSSASQGATPEFQACNFYSNFTKDPSKCPGYDPSKPTSTLCGVPCEGLCQNGQPHNGQGSDPSCQPLATGLPAYMEACKAWDYHLNKTGIDWVKPFHYDTLVKKDLDLFCLGPGSISFPKGNNPCMIHQKFGWREPDNMGCTINKFVPNGSDKVTPEFKNIFDSFQKAHQECKSKEGEDEYCLVDVKDPSSGNTVKAALSMGHGANHGICGSITLMRYKPPLAFEPAGCGDSKGACHEKVTAGLTLDRKAPTGFVKDFRYIVNLQIGMRSWSGELSGFEYLAPGNDKGNACDVMETVDVDLADIDFSKTSKICCQNFADGHAAPCEDC